MFLFDNIIDILYILFVVAFGGGGRIVKKIKYFSNGSLHNSRKLAWNQKKKRV